MRERMTRRDRVRDLFWRSDVVCSLEAFYRSGELHNGRNDVGVIEREPGWQIRHEWIDHHDGAGKHVDYIVERRPPPEQIALIA